MNEQEETVKPERSMMSPFCEALMNACEEVNELRTPSDTALVLCTDGKILEVRQCGLYPDALRMLYTKMSHDDKFAELIMEASLLYSRHVLGNKVPISTTIIKPIK